MLNDVRIAKINGVSRSTGPKWARAYHGNVTEYGEQNEGNTHVSVVLMYIASSETECEPGSLNKTLTIRWVGSSGRAKKLRKLEGVETDSLIDPLLGEKVQ